MKRIISLLLIAALFLLPVPGTAEGTAEYSDSAYSFRYPSNWTQRLDYDGSVILELPGTQDSVISFAIINDMLQFTGDEAADTALAERIVSQYTAENAQENGKHTVLSGEYELVTRGNLRGIRAKGTWTLSGEELVMIMLTGESHLVAFQLNGPEAIALEDELLDSVELAGGLDASSAGDGFVRWDGAEYAVLYSAHYRTMETATGIMFANPDDPSNVIAVRTYALDYDYEDSMAPLMASALMPKSAKVTADPEVMQIGGRTVACIRGDIESGPLAYYLFGEGRTLYVVLLSGTEATGMGGEIVASVEPK